MAKITINSLLEIKARRERFACLTAYDSTFSMLISKAEIEVILVGDSLGNVLQGHQTTLPVTVKHMAYHTSCVTRLEPDSLVVTDLPFMSYSTPEKALRSATIAMQSGAEVVKIEGGDWVSPIISRLVERGIPVCAHLGLTPQSIHMLGGYKIQGRSEADAEVIMSDAIKIQEAGASLLVLECIPKTLAGKITEKLEIPVIGIGAGGETDGQILVLHDMLGLSKSTPKFSKNFLEGNDSIEAAIRNFRDAVKSGEFPKV